MCRARKNREADDFAYMMYLRRKDGMRLDMPDVALDQHTRRGKEMGRGRILVQRRNRLSNRVEIEGNPYENGLRSSTASRVFRLIIRMAVVMKKIMRRSIKED